MQGTLWEWNVEKLAGVPSQILVTCPLHAVNKKINAIQYENDNEMTIAKSWMK